MRRQRAVFDDCSLLLSYDNCLVSELWSLGELLFVVIMKERARERERARGGSENKKKLSERERKKEKSRVHLKANGLLIVKLLLDTIIFQ